ncbi:MAG TPA: methyl-accepting chemotaxis protein [Ktedonobacteraceae bacterium]|nr:methyl-accepting chemotaxis protein [Ktedonobacteraceae bacterium]
MNDTDRGGMTISSLLMMGLVFSLAIPEIAIFALGVLRGPLDQTAFTIALVVCVLVVLVGVLAVYYFVRRRIQERFLALVEVCRNFAGGDRAVRATVVGDDEFSMLCQSLNSLLDNQSFSSGGTPSAATGDAAALQAQIEKLLQEVSAVGDGDLRVQAEVTPDTLGVLADSFNYMIEELAKVVGRVQATAVQVTNATRRVLDRSAELAQASETQVKQIQQTTQAVEALAIFIQNVARNAQLSAEAAQDALRHASTGQEGVRQTIDGMMRIRENVQETAKKIKRLGERSNEIGEIVRIIEDIADQTNLLALNAAIQSAMAGEHGRGFAVVADEIRLLAERSTESTKRIETLVKSIQGDTFEAVVAMEDSTQEVVKGSQLADDAGRALNSIYSAVERQAQMIETIARAANEQVQVSESVAVAMGEISEITRQTNNGMQESAMSVSYLAELADQLRTSVSTFRLPEQANEMVDVFPSMQGVPALPGADNNQYYQQDMGANNNDWNSGFSSDFLSLPQPQEMANSGPQFAFSNQQDFVPQASFSNGGQFGEQQFGTQPGGFEQHFSGQQFGAQPGGFEQHFSGQQFGSQPGFDQHFNGQQFGNQPASFGNPGGQFDQFASDFGGFDSQQSFNGQQHFEPMRDSGFNNPPVVPNGRMPQQNAGPQPGTSAGGIRPRIRPQNPQSFNQDQVPFPNNGHMGQ